MNDAPGNPPRAPPATRSSPPPPTLNSKVPADPKDVGLRNCSLPNVCSLLGARAPCPVKACSKPAHPSDWLLFFAAIDCKAAPGAEQKADGVLLVGLQCLRSGLRDSWE